MVDVECFQLDLVCLHEFDVVQPHHPELLLLHFADVIHALGGACRVVVPVLPHLALHEQESGEQPRETEQNDQHLAHPPTLEHLVKREEGHQAETLHKEQREHDGVSHLVGDLFVHENHVNHVDRIASHLDQRGCHQEHPLVLRQDQQTAHHDIQEEGEDLNPVAALIVREDTGEARQELEDMDLGEDECEFLVGKLEFFFHLFGGERNYCNSCVICYHGCSN